MNYKSVILIIIYQILSTNVYSQILKDMNGVDDFKDDKELLTLFTEMNKFTYAFCKIEKYLETDNFGRDKKLSNRYNIIGVFDSPDTSYAKRIVFERVLIKGGKNLYDSVFEISTLLNEDYNKDKAWEFFLSLDSYGFHKLENECLMNKSFPSPNNPEWKVMVNLTHVESEVILLLAHQKIRRINCYAPEYIFKSYPDQNLCRAIFIICRNIFHDRIWDN